VQQCDAERKARIKAEKAATMLRAIIVRMQREKRATEAKPAEQHVG
jgi:hypothetical protein